MPQDLIEIIKGFFSRPSPCEKLIRYYGTKVEISVSGGMMGVNLDLKNINKQIREITSATEYAKILDDYQYLLCKEIVNSSSDIKFSQTLKKYRILIMTYIARIGLIMKQIQDGFIEGLKEEIIKISQNMQNLITKLEKTLLEE